MQSAGLRTSVFRATALSGAIHLGVDLLSSRFAWTTPPYLLLEYASDAFRDLLLVDPGTIRVGGALAAALVNGAIAGLFAAALAQARHRVAALSAALFGLWVFSGGLMMLVYLDPPWRVALGSLAAGAPRALAVAWAVEWLVYRPAERTAEGPASGPRG
jgi:hypothetical protein